MSEPDSGQPAATSAQPQLGQTLPPEIPELWLQKISQASSSRLSLPDIPESWLAKIKEATKPDLVSAVLGSSLLAAIIAMASATLTSYMTNRGAEKLEQTKLELQSKSDQVKKRIRAYSILAQNLDSLASALDAYLRMSQIAAKAPRDAVSSLSLSAQHNKVGLAEKEVLAAEKDVSGYDKALPSEVDACLAKLSLALAATQVNPRASSSLNPVLDELRQLASSVNVELNKSLAVSPFGG